MRDPSTGKHYDWDLINGEKTVAVKVNGQMMVTDTGGLLAACLSGHGIGQPLEIYTRPFIADGRLVQLLPEWAEEKFPLYIYHHAPQMMSAKVRSFLDYVDEVIK